MKKKLFPAVLEIVKELNTELVKSVVGLLGLIVRAKELNAGQVNGLSAREAPLQAVQVRRLKSIRLVMLAVAVQKLIHVPGVAICPQELPVE